MRKGTPNGTSTKALTEKGRRTRARILASASELVFERGVAGTTMDDVQAAANVGPSQLYHYFPSKNALIREVIRFQEEGVVGSQEQTLAHLDSLDGLLWIPSMVCARGRTQSGVACVRCRQEAVYL